MGGTGETSVARVGGDDPFFRFPPGFRSPLGPDDLPTQGRSVVEGSRSTAVQEKEPGPSDLDYLSVRDRTRSME